MWLVEMLTLLPRSPTIMGGVNPTKEMTPNNIYQFFSPLHIQFDVSVELCSFIGSAYIGNYDQPNLKYVT